MAKLTLEEKRRQTLRRQLYGKDQTPDQSSTRRISATFQNTTQTDLPVKDDQAFLKSDLIKILIMSVVAIALQLALFFALNSHLITLPLAL